MNSAHSQPHHLLLGVTGGIAAYKTAELIRLLIKQGHSVQVVMTEAATHFITPTTLQLQVVRRVDTASIPCQSGKVGGRGTQPRVFLGQD